jgi:hypothetical protein
MLNLQCTFDFQAKKVKKSRSPSREEDNTKRFQSVQERQRGLSTHRTTVLDDYGFKVHRNQESDRPFEKQNDHKFGAHHHDKHPTSMPNHHQRNPRQFGNFRKPNGGRNHNHYDKNRRWEHRGHR